MQTERSADLSGFARVEGRAVVAAFDGGAMTSEAGAMLLGAADGQIRLIERFAGCFTDYGMPDLVEYEDRVWDATTFTKNRDRLLEGDIAEEFLAAVLADDKVKGLLSSEHFSVDGTLLEAWASAKSFRLSDGSGEPPGEGRNGERDFHGEQRTNDTHASTTDPDARLYRKSLPLA